MRAALVTLFAFCVTFPILGGQIHRIDPQSITVGSGEHFVTLYGRDLGAIVRFTGPAGTFELEASSGGGTAVYAWVPTEVVNTAGSHAVSVLGGPAGDSNAIGFEVVDPNPIPLTVAPHDPVTAVAATREGAIVTFEVVAYGGRDPNPVVTCDPPSGSRFRLGPTNVRCIATNSFGEFDEGGVYVYVYDVGIPVLNLPDDITVPSDGNGAVVTFQATATDVIDGAVPVTCAPASGSRFPVGITRVDCSATDTSYNTATGSFTVTVTSTEPERLMIHVPADITAEAEGAFGAVVMFTVTADGTSDPNPVISCNPASGSAFALGTTTVSCVASDKFGNHAADDFTITVVDTTPPQLTIPDQIVVTADGPDGATVTFEATAYDAVAGDTDVTCTPPSGSRFPVGTTTVECRTHDGFGNSSGGAFDVIVRERQALVINVPGPITVEAENHDGAVVTFTVTAGGTSDPDPDITCTPASGSTFAVGTTAVQCTATDSNGNSASDGFDVNVIDTIDPVISGITATPDVLSPPNNKLIPVTISVDVSDVADAMPRCFAFSVTGDEDINGDFRLVSDLQIELRASRQKDERTYTVHVRCVDDSANAADGSVTVRVPKGSEQSTTPTPAPKRRAVGGG